MLKPSIDNLENVDQDIKNYIKYIEFQLSEKNDLLQKKDSLLQKKDKVLQGKDGQITLLQTQLSSTQTQLSLTQTKLQQYRDKIIRLLEQLKLKNRKIFSSSSEKTAALCGELPFFNEPEAIHDELDEAEKQQPEPSYRAKKQKGHKEKVLKDLPVEIENVKLDEAQQICSCCGNPMHEMGFDEREELIPITEYKVRVIREYKYSCRYCEKNAEKVKIVKAKGSKSVIEKSYASAEMLSHIIGQKFFNASSLYRIERSLSLDGIDVSRQTMSNWLIYIYKNYLSHYYDYLHKELLKQEIIQADETTVQVLREKNRNAKQKSYMWVYRTSGNAPEIILFDYQMSRESENVLAFLKNFNGKYIQSDGFEGYGKVIKKWSEKDKDGNPVKEVKLAGCWAHARRKFVEAVELLPAAERKNANNLAVAGLLYINELYKISKEDFDNEEKRQNRLNKLKFHLSVMQDWMNKKETLPKTHSGRAVQYLRNQWSRLTVFLENEYISLDNNAAERAIRLFVLGRKNWLFAITPNGANASAAIYSIIQTAQANGLNPLKYIEYLLKLFPNIDLKDENVFAEIVPWHKNMQEQFFSTTMKGV